MTETKNAKKNRYQAALEVYTQAMTALRKGDYQKSEKLLTTLLDKYGTEVELADRARLYLAICDKKKDHKKVVLKTYEDYLYHGIYLMNHGREKDALKNFDNVWTASRRRLKWMSFLPFWLRMNQISNRFGRTRILRPLRKDEHQGLLCGASLCRKGYTI